MNVVSRRTNKLSNHYQMPIAAFSSKCNADSVIPPACQQWLAAPLPAVLLPAARPHTASSGLSGTFAGCRGPALSSWRPAGGEWPGDTQLFASVSQDRSDVWPGIVMHYNHWFCCDIRINYIYINIVQHSEQTERDVHVCVKSTAEKVAMITQESQTGINEPYQELLAQSRGDGLCFLDNCCRECSHFCCSKTLGRTKHTALVSFVFLASWDICLSQTTHRIVFPRSILA